MSSLSDAEINSIIPKSGPSIEQVKKYLENIMMNILLLNVVEVY